MAVGKMAGVKRKRENGTSKSNGTMRRAKISPTSSTDDDDQLANILDLESQIQESRRHYNNIATLISILRKENDEAAKAAAVALCRIFVRLMTAGAIERRKGLEQTELVIVQWLQDRYQEYTGLLLETFGEDQQEGDSFLLTILMRLVKAEAGESRGQEQRDASWKRGLFRRTLSALLQCAAEPGHARDEFTEKYVTQYDDIRYYTLGLVTSELDAAAEEAGAENVLANALLILSAIEDIPDAIEDLNNFYGARPQASKHVLLTPSAHKKQAAEAWLAVIRAGLNMDQRKQVLGLMTTHIVPYVTRLEKLMDFLTDSYNAGGAMSLLALAGLFHLMQEKNLDYPSFYPKLYSLLDENLLHSKHRSRFFRLLNVFLGSTHLPAALVASFIKRLSRLALHAPPAGVVAVVPWVYNMLKAHPACTFMIHREVRDPGWKEQLEEGGMEDPFDMDEADPMQTDAIESSLWELETLQSHYHPNVATLCKIISEQFTKKGYDIEDFLGYSYDGVSFVPNCRCGRH